MAFTSTTPFTRDHLKAYAFPDNPNRERRAGVTTISLFGFLCCLGLLLLVLRVYGITIFRIDIFRIDIFRIRLKSYNKSGFEFAA
jgi:hypothetical protein